MEELNKGAFMSTNEMDTVESARLAGFELGENKVINVGFFFYPAGSRDDAPITWPTVQQAWDACCDLNNIEPTQGPSTEGRCT